MILGIMDSISSWIFFSFDCKDSHLDIIGREQRRGVVGFEE